MTNKIIVGIAGIVLVTMCYSMKRMVAMNEEPFRLEHTTPIDSLKTDTFSEANLILLINELKIKEPNIVLAQSKLETGNFSSYLFLKSNNLFGFRGWSSYHKYDDWQSSVKAYKKWQDKNYKGGNYYSFLINVGYAEDSLYIQKLKQF